VFWRLPRDIMARQLAKGSPKCNGTVDNDVNGRCLRSLRGGNCFTKCARATRALFLSRFVRGMKAEEKSALARPRSREAREFPREAPAHAKGRNRVTEAPLSCLRILEIGSTLFDGVHEPSSPRSANLPKDRPQLAAIRSRTISSPR